MTIHGASQAPALDSNTKEENMDTFAERCFIHYLDYLAKKYSVYEELTTYLNLKPIKIYYCIYSKNKYRKTHHPGL